MTHHTHIQTVAFDADDTLWHNQPIFENIHAEFRALLAEHAPGNIVDERLLAVEVRNLVHYGYSIKGFTLSMIESACELTENRITGREIVRILDWGKAMRNAPTELLPDVARVVAEIAQSGCHVMLITKGDLFDQEAKLARSGIGGMFSRVEIVSEKDEATYRRILTRHAIAPETFLMAGNSVKSDVLPVLACGGHAVHIPYHTTWAHEKVALNPDSPAFATLSTIAELPMYLQNRRESA